jgi:peptide deformylase
MPIVEVDPRAPSPSSVLRKRAALLDPTDRTLGQLVERMRATLEKSGGVGLAAPQVGVSRRLILVRHGTRPEGQPTRIAVYVNPRIEWASEAIDEDYEGCLSIPGVGGLVPRVRQLRLHYQLPGKHDELSVELVDWDARIVQHEMDHLNGTLYVDRLRGELLSQEETKRLRDEAHRRRGWLRAAAEPPPEEGARP